MGAILQLFREMGQTRLLALGGLGALLLAFFGWLAFHNNTPALAPLYTDLSIEDSARIVSELDKQNVAYELRGNGSQIMVPADQMLKLRLTLAQAGLPSGGSIVGYEIFDRSDTMGTSSFVMNINMIRALEGELARTIASMAQVQSARVNLVIPKQELFTHEHQEPTASVMVKFKGTSELTRDEIGGITHLIAAAVPGLQASHVTLVDNKGHMLAGGHGEEGDASMTASNAQEHKLAYESHLKNTLETLLEKSVGIGKVKVTVNADIDFDRIVTNSETFDPASQVARSVQTDEEREQSNEKEPGNTSVSNNLPNAQGNRNEAGSSRTTSKTGETTNYEISKTVQNHVKETGKINRLTVGVLVDGIYAEDAAGKQIYTPRSDEERRQLETLVKSAIGFDDKRGDHVDIVNMRFIAPVEDNIVTSPLEWLKQDFRSIVQTLVFGGVAVLVILLIVRPLVKRILETTLAVPVAAGAGTYSLSPEGVMEGAAMMEGAAGAGPAGAAGAPQGGFSSAADAVGLRGLAAGGAPFAAQGEEDNAAIGLGGVSGKVKSSLYNRLNETVKRNPEEALTILRQWTSKRN